MDKDWQDYKVLYGGVAGSRTAFEKTCRKLFKAKFPGKNVKTVAVKQGDGGIDVYVGELGLHPISVFQCKFFIENFGDSQKTQIKKSFNTAITSTKYKMSDWNLCIPCELDIDNQSWWANWKDSMKKKYKITINLFDGDDLVDELKAVNLYNSEFKIDEKRYDIIYCGFMFFTGTYAKLDLIARFKYLIISSPAILFILNQFI